MAGGTLGVRDRRGGFEGSARDPGPVRVGVRGPSCGACGEGAEDGEGEVRGRAVHDDRGSVCADCGKIGTGSDVALPGRPLLKDVRDHIREREVREGFERDPELVGSDDEDDRSDDHGARRRQGVGNPSSGGPYSGGADRDGYEQGRVEGEAAGDQGRDRGNCEAAEARRSAGFGGPARQCEQRGEVPPLRASGSSGAFGDRA